MKAGLAVSLKINRGLLIAKMLLAAGLQPSGHQSIRAGSLRPNLDDTYDSNHVAGQPCP
jgi:hypothetical protein